MRPILEPLLFDVTEAGNPSAGCVVLFAGALFFLGVIAIVLALGIFAGLWMVGIMLALGYVLGFLVAFIQWAKYRWHNPE